MSKNALLGLAAAMCLVVAGVGLFFMAQPDTAQVSAPEPGVSVAPERVAASASQTAGTVGVIPEPAPPAATALPPTSTMPPPTTASGARPTGRPAPSSGGTYGSTGSAPSSGGLDRPWPSGTATQPPPATVPPPITPPPTQDPVVEQPPVSSLPPPLPPPEPQFEELVVSADSVLGIKLDSTVNSETAKVEDPVEAHVTRDVRVGSRVAIPVGSRVLGSVTQVEQGGKAKTKARLGIRFHTVVLSDGARTQIQTDPIYREGESPGQEAAAKVGAAAAGGAILGAILGGGKGAAIGAGIGAAGGGAAVMAGKRNPAVLQSGSAFTVRLLQPVTVTVDR